MVLVFLRVKQDIIKESCVQNHKWHNTTDFKEGVLAPSDGASAAAALCLKLEHRVLKDTSIMLDLLIKHLTSLAAQLENELNTLNPN